MSGDQSAGELIAAQHGPGGAAHLMVVAALAVVALVIYGVVRWRRKRQSAAAPTGED